MNLILLALARSIAPLALAHVIARLRVPAHLRRRALRTAVVLSLFAATSAFLAPYGPSPSRQAAWPVVPIVQPDLPVDSVIPKFARERSPRSEDPFAVPVEALYGFGTLLALLPLVIGAVRIRRVNSATEPVVDRRIQDELEHVSRHLGIRRPEVRSGAKLRSPFVAGLWCPTIYLPPMADGAVRAILSHEAAHLRNRDVVWRCFHRIACAALWPQPLLWLLLRPARAIEEEACDQDALRAGLAPMEYARTLLAVAESPLPTLAIGMRSSHSALACRIAALIHPPAMNPRLRSFFALGAISALLATLGGAVCLAAGRPQDDGPTLVPKGDQVIDVVDAAGRPVTPVSASILVYGEAFDQPVIPARAGRGQVTYSLDRVKPRGAAMLMVELPGHGIAFRRVYPPDPSSSKITVAAAPLRKVQLREPEGKPAKGVRVFPVLLADQTSGEFLSMPPGLAAKFSQTTNERGEAAFPGIGADRMVFDSDDARYAALDATIEKGTTFVTTRLVPAGEITGRVIRDGKPVSGVAVAAQENLEKRSIGRGNAWAMAKTDADGRYRLRRLPPAIVNVALFDASFPSGLCAPAREAVAVARGGRVTGQDFRLEPGATLTGTVYGYDGKPKAGVMLGIYGPAHPNSSAWVQSATTDATGRYVTTVPPGEQKLYVMDGRYDQEMETFLVVKGQTHEKEFHLRPAKESN